MVQVTSGRTSFGRRGSDDAQRQEPAVRPVLHAALPAPLPAPLTGRGEPAAEHRALPQGFAAQHPPSGNRAAHLAAAGPLAAQRPLLVVAEYAVLASCTAGAVYLILFG